MKETKSIKVDMKVYKKVKRHAAKNKQTIGGLFELGAESLLSVNQEFTKWREKAEKWDALADQLDVLYPRYQMSDADALDEISRATVIAFGFEEE